MQATAPPRAKAARVGDPGVGLILSYTTKNLESLRQKTSAPTFVEDVELEAGIGRKNCCHFFQAFGEPGRRKQRILTLAQLVIVNVQVEREHVNGNGIRKGGIRVVRFSFFVYPAGVLSGGLLAELKSIQAGFAAHPAGRLFPHQIGEFGRGAGFLDKSVSHVDVELKGDGELVIQQASGDEYALRVPGINVAMTDGLVFQGVIEAFGNQSLVTLAHGQGNKIESLAIQRGSDAVRHRRDHGLQVRKGKVDLTGSGIEDPVGRLADTRIANHLRRRAQLCMGGPSHGSILSQAVVTARKTHFSWANLY